MSPTPTQPTTELERVRADIAAHAAPNNPPKYLDGDERELLTFSAFGRNWRRASRTLRSSVRLAAFTILDLAAFAPPLEMTEAELRAYVAGRS